MTKSANEMSQQQQNCKPTYEIVKLNIGGYKYTTTRQTLLKPDEKTFFSALLNGHITSWIDDDGAYFIDRNGVLEVPPETSISGVYSLANFFLVPLPAMTSRISNCVISHQMALMTLLNGAPILDTLRCDRQLMLPNTDFIAVSFAFATLSKCQFQQSIFTHVDFSNCSFDRCDFRHCKFISCTFDEGKVSRCVFNEVQLLQCTFVSCVFETTTSQAESVSGDTEIDMRNSTIRDCDFTGASLTRINLSLSSIENTSFAHSRMQHVDLRNVHLLNVSFDLVEMTHSSFNKSELVHVRFTGARLGGEIDALNISTSWSPLTTSQTPMFADVTFNHTNMSCVNFYHASFHINDKDFFGKTFAETSLKNILCHSVINHWKPNSPRGGRDFGINQNDMRMAFLREMALHSDHMAVTLDHPVGKCPAITSSTSESSTVEMMNELNCLHL
eukprot:CFRG7286T1